MPERPAQIPEPLEKVLQELEGMDPQLRAAVLVEYADEFQTVPEGIARRPYPEEHRVPACESEAYVWAEDGPGETVKYHFAVENPQGISAKALSVILSQTVSGQPASEIAGIPSAIVQRVFGRELSMGKGAGLQGIVGMVTAEARKRLAAGNRD
jgi:cysteine desulfuration protein SufE